MYTGQPLDRFARQIMDRAERREDYLAPATSLQVEARDGDVVATMDTDRGALAVVPNSIAHQQLAGYTPLPKTYYDVCREQHPELLARELNTWLADKPKPRLFRTLRNDGGAHTLDAFLSDRYRPLDYAALAEQVLPVVADLDVEILGCEVTDRRLYIKAVDKRIQRDIPAGRKMGDGTHTIFRTNSPAIVISNSDVGMGALSVETSIYDHVCTNMAIFSQRSLRKYHVGGILGNAGDSVAALLSDDTRKKTDEAVWLQVRDIVGAAFDEAKFEAEIERIAATVDDKIDGDINKTISNVAKRFALTEGTGNNLLKHLIEGGELNRFGVYNAVTRTAEDQGDMDAATDLERIGGKILDLTPSEWKELVAA